MIRSIKKGIGRLMRSAGYELRRSRKDSRLVFTSIPGWFSHEEAELLYLLGFMVQGRILEIGHFLGRSTSVLCEAIRDSSRKTEFNSYDIGFKTADEFLAFYKKVYRQEHFEVPAELQEMIFSRNQTTTAVAKEYLASFNLAKYVTLYAADFNAIDHTQYDLIFCDAMHDPHEISINLPGVIDNSRDLCTWAFHDMSDANINAVLAANQAVRFVTRVDTLGVFQYAP